MESQHLPTVPLCGGMANTGECESLAQAGAALRSRHFKNARLRPNYWLSHALRGWTSSRLAQAIARQIARQQRSIRKRREQLRSLFNPGNPQPPTPSPESAAPLLFNERYYKAQWPTKRRPKTSWWDDYQQIGWKQGFNPHPLFDVRWYLQTNPDVEVAGAEPLAHFLNKGWEQGRDPNPYFQTDWYIANNPELLAQNINPVLHYLEVGWKNGRDPGPRFSLQHYFAESPHADKTVEPLSEWLQELPGKNEGDKHREYVHWPTAYLPSEVEPLPSHDFGKIAVQLHAFYLDKLDLLLDHLKYIPVHFDLLVSTDTPEHAREIEAMVAKSGLDCALDVRCSQNRGRDVAPLICLFGRKLLDYDCALHIHTKKSASVKADADYGHHWLMHNLGFLARNPEYVQGILSQFGRNPNCGVLVPKPWKGIRRVMTWTSNRPYAEKLMERLHLPRTLLKTQPLMFPSGTMFWFRPAALKPLLTSDLCFEDFPAEPLPNDGTLAHAIERCILYIALSQGYHSLVIAPSIYKTVC